MSVTAEKTKAQRLALGQWVSHMIPAFSFLSILEEGLNHVFVYDEKDHSPLMVFRTFSGDGSYTINSLSALSLRLLRNEFHKFHYYAVFIP